MAGRFDLTGQRAVVTGAGRGIGKAIALALAEAGADVALLARTPSELATTQGLIEERGRRAIALPTDVGDGAQIRRAASGRSTSSAVGSISWSTTPGRSGGRVSWR